MSNFLNIPTVKAPQSVGAQASGSQTSATGNPRNKTALKPGRSLMDWVRLGSSGKDLAGTGGRLIRVTRSELAKHNTEDDAWICIRGKVYNITPYMEFHPGGIPELMRGVGTDATLLFDEIHKWVNYESMLAKCLLGPLVSEGQPAPRSKLVTSSNAVSASTSLMPPPSAPFPKVVQKTPPRFDWFQTDALVNLVFYPRLKEMKHEYVMIEKLDDRKLKVTLQVDGFTFTIVLQLGGAIKNDYAVRVSKLTGKVEIDLQKEIHEEKWLELKTDSSIESTFIKTSEISKEFRKCAVESIQAVSHDTKLYCIALPAGTRMVVPIGHHVQVEESVLGMKISRNYTAITQSLATSATHQNQGKYIYLMIKIYPDGTLTPLIGLLKPQDEVHISAMPQGAFDCSVLNDVANVTLFAAGTGFTPMARLINYMLVCDFKIERKIKLVFFNKEEKDILWKEQLDELQRKHANFTVHHVLSKPHSDWSGAQGRIRMELIGQFVAKPRDGSMFYFCACGPTPFTDECVRLVKQYGYTDAMLHAFLG